MSNINISVCKENDLLIPRIKKSVFSLDLYHALVNLTSSLISKISVDPRTNLIVEIPRGGCLLMPTIRRKWPTSDVVTANTGKRKVNDIPMINLPQNKLYSSFILSDVYAITGNTIIDVISCLANQVKPNTIAYIHCVLIGITPQFIKNIRAYASILKQSMPIDILTVYIEHNVTMIKLSQQKDNTPIIGNIYKDNKGNILGYEIGDFGEFYHSAVQRKIL